MGVTYNSRAHEATITRAKVDVLISVTSFLRKHLAEKKCHMILKFTIESTSSLLTP